MDSFMVSSKEQLDEVGGDPDKLELLQLRRDDHEADLSGEDLPPSPVSRCAPAWTPKISFSSTANQETERTRAIRALYFCSLVTSLGLSITISSLWPYIYNLNSKESPRMLGWINFAMGGSSICGIVAFAAWVQYTSPRFPLILSVVFLFTGGALHLCAQAIVDLNTKILLMSRCFCAIAAGVSVVSFLSLNHLTMVHERTRAMLKLMTSQAVGYMIGAGLQALLTLTGEKGLMWHRRSLHFNAFTSVGLFLMIIAIVNFVVILIFAKLPRLEEDSSRSQGEPYTSRERRRKRRKQIQKKDAAPDYRAIAVCITALFCLEIVRCFHETMATLLGIDQLQWPRIRAIQITTAIQIVWAGAAILGIWTVKKIAGRIGERMVLTSGFLLIFVLTLIMIPFRRSDAYPKDTQNATCEYTHCGSETAITGAQYFLVLLLFPFGYFLTFLVLLSRFEKIARPLQRVSSISLWLMIQACAQLIGPIAFTSLYVDTDLRWSVLCLVFFPALGFVLLLITYKRLVSYHVYLIAKQTSSSKEMLDMG